MALKAIVLGAGKGTRMNSDLAKVLHPVAGRPMLLWALDALAAAVCDETVVVVGHQADAVRSILPAGIKSALQQEQLGTGHAAQIGLAALQVSADDDVLVMPGDMPLIRSETLLGMIDLHHSTGAAATVLSVELDDPGAYGRIIREAGHVVGIVEAKDATQEQLAVSEVSTSVYTFSGRWLAETLARIGNENAQREFYLTDAIGILVGDGHRVEAYVAGAEEGLGINSVDQIAGVEAILGKRNTDC